MSLGYGGKSGLGEKQASGKTHDVGVGREKQAEKPTPEAYCKVAERKVGAERNWRAEKPTVWAREEKNKQENPSWKLIVRLRREKWARREIGRRKNPRRGRGKRKTSRKTCGKGDRNADNAVGLFMRDLSVFSESTQVLQFKLKGSLFVFDRSFVIDCLLL